MKVNMVDHIDRRNSQQVYDEQAADFATKAPALLTWEFIGRPAILSRVKEALKNPHTTQALDIGSASGRIVGLLVGLDIPEGNITGVEISPEEVKIAKITFPQAKFLVGDIAEVELPQEKFDLVTSYMVWEFLDNEKLEKALKRVYSTMKPGATLIYGTTHPGRYEGKYRVSDEGWVKTGGPWGGGGFENFYRKADTFKRLTMNAGFTIMSTEELDLPKEAQEKYPERVSKFDSFGAPVRLFVVARKP